MDVWVKLNERKKNEELRELLGLEPDSLMIKKSRLRLFGHVERKDDNDWVKRCITWEVEGIRQRGHPRKTWWDCVKYDMESLSLSQKDVQSRNKWRRRIKGQPANSGSPGKVAVKTECVCVCVCARLISSMNTLLGVKARVNIVAECCETASLVTLSRNVLAGD